MPAWGWNDDEIAPGRGFDTHPHRDMEIVTYVRADATIIGEAKLTITANEPAEIVLG